MANQSGTLTSSQGSAFIGTTPNDTITFTPSAGTYTVEYPLGTVAISASTSTQSLPVSGGQVRVTCASGSVAWAVSDGNDGTPLSQTELLSVRSLVSGAWNGYRTVLFGDSMVDTYETVVANVTGVYDNATGILTVTSTAHQQAIGWYLTIWNKSFTATNKLFRVPVLIPAPSTSWTW